MATGKQRPVASPIAQVAEDTGFGGIEVGVAMVPDGEDIQVTVAIGVAELQFGVPLLPVQGVETRRALNESELASGVGSYAEQNE